MSPSVAHLRYAGRRVCREHFLDLTWRRILREVRKQGPYPSGTRIAVALSGGKDSVSALRALHKIFSVRKDVEIWAVTVDEGISSYRPRGVEIARRTAQDLGVPWKLLSYKEMVGVEMDEIAPRSPGRLPCAYCGVFRRRALNTLALSVQATHLATGHNLDDRATTVLMNLLKGDTERLLRLAPHEDRLRGLVPRILPLRSIPEKEVALFALLQGWEFHDGECPYSQGATRGRIRDLLLDLEEESPGTRHALVRGVEELVQRARKGKVLDPPRPCPHCGEPTSQGKCMSCTLLAEVGE